MANGAILLSKAGVAHWVVLLISSKSVLWIGGTAFRAGMMRMTRDVLAPILESIDAGDAPGQPVCVDYTWFAAKWKMVMLGSVPGYRLGISVVTESRHELGDGKRESSAWTDVAAFLVWTADGFLTWWCLHVGTIITQVWREFLPVLCSCPQEVPA